MSSTRDITLKSSDGKAFNVDEEVARKSQTIKHIIDDCTDDCIFLPNVTANILAKVIEYCKKHVKAASTCDLKTWDAEFMKANRSTLYDLMMGANYLNIQSLLELTCKTMANMIKEKTPEEIRKTYNIENDFTPEEEAEVHRENQRAFE